MKKHLLIAGGTGLIGKALRKEALLMGWEVTLLSRKEGKGIISWDPAQESIALESPQSFEAIVNLTGTNIGGARWTEKRKKDILHSRLNSCKTLEKYLSEETLKTNVYVGISGIGFYGDGGSIQVDDFSPPDPHSGWMSTTVLQWEAGHKRIGALGIRTVILRTGIVLSMQGGALVEILQTNRLGLLFYFGNGNQFWPWIHIQDLVRILWLSISNEKWNGTFLAVAPHAVSNKELTRVASRQYSLNRLVLPAPVPMLAVVLGQMHQMLMDSCNAFPARLLSEGFEFQYPTIKEALSDLISRR